ncbi:hypothetical protein DFH09DRAFT_1109102 [Mycena vulgaris]|nr:hypothetical protein DFH09DRAFT_1109102 [Mycena vulgaris]
MAFSALSLLLSASDASLPDSSIRVIGTAFGLSPAACGSRLRIFASLSDRRASVLAAHSDRVPSLSVFNQLEDLPKGTLLALARSHGLGIDPRPGCSSRDILKDAIMLHLSSGQCLRREGLVSHLSCASLVSQFAGDRLQDQSEDSSTVLQLHILRQVCPILKLKPLRRLLELHDVSYVESDNVKRLCSRLKAFLTRLKLGKQFVNNGSETGKQTRARQNERLRLNGPSSFPNPSNAASWTILVLASLRANSTPTKTGTGEDDVALDLLPHPARRSSLSADSSIPSPPRHPIATEDIVMEDAPGPVASPALDPPLDQNGPLQSGHEDDDVLPPRPAPWLSPDCPEPPMPNPPNSPYSDLLLDAACVEHDPETNALALVCCPECRSALKGNRVPPRAVANYNYLGPVPPELAGLTLRDQDPHMSTTQRGVRDHIIVYPQRPSDIAQSTYALVAYSLEVIQPAFLRVVGVDDVDVSAVSASASQDYSSGDSTSSEDEYANLQDGNLLGETSQHIDDEGWKRWGWERHSPEAADGLPWDTSPSPPGSLTPIKLEPDSVALFQDIQCDTLSPFEKSVIRLVRDSMEGRDAHHLRLLAEIRLLSKNFD